VAAKQIAVCIKYTWDRITRGVILMSSEFGNDNASRSSSRSLFSLLANGLRLLAFLLVMGGGIFPQFFPTTYTTILASAALLAIAGNFFDIQDIKHNQ